MQTHADALPPPLERVGEPRWRRGRQRDQSKKQSKTAVMPAQSISAKSGQTPIGLTIIEGSSSWRAPGSHSTSSPRFTAL
jgi:hypothetical protein